MPPVWGAEGELQIARARGGDENQPRWRERERERERERGMTFKTTFHSYNGDIMVIKFIIR
jgi:hypothetical protein